MTGTRKDQITRITPETRSAMERAVPVEAAISLEINGIAYAVMMATPTDLEDFGVGFVLSEGLASTITDIKEVTVFEAELGWVVRIWLTDAKAGIEAARVRVRMADSACGICGLENLEQVSKPLPPITARLDVSNGSVFKALNALRDYQPLNKATGGVHAAAFCSADGDILAVREDVGRHNGLDKLIGHLAREGIDPKTGFILLSSRCSYELVEKTVMAGCAMLVTVSIATSMAVDRARQAGLSLIALARSDAMLDFS